jgi:hypothetical protein
MVLTERAIGQAFHSLSPGALGVSRKRLRNAECDLRFAVRFYGSPLPEQPVAPSEAVQTIERMVSDRFAKIPSVVFSAIWYPRA